MKRAFSVALSAAFAVVLAAFTASASGGDSGEVASVGTQQISKQDLDARTAAKLDAKRREFENQDLQLKLNFAREQSEIQQQELQAILDERVLALEAGAKKSTTAILLKDLKVPAVTDSQIQQFFNANKGMISQTYANVAPSIRDYLQKQQQATAERQYLDSLRSKYHVVSMLEPLREQVAPNGPRLGRPDAKVTIVEFSDFQCPFCARFESVLHEVLPKYQNSVSLVYRNYPLRTLHPNAQLAAEAGACAQQQDKFWQMHDAMFADQSALSADALKETASRIGADPETFGQCLSSGQGRAAVDADIEAGNQLALSGTPASFVNGRFMHGALSAEELTAVINDELRRRAATTAADNR